MKQKDVFGYYVDCGVYTKYLSTFHQVRHHDDDLRLLLPDHSPELAETRGHRSLRRDVGLGAVRAVHVVGVNVV